MVRINVPQIGNVDIYNTHYQATIQAEDLRVMDNKEFSILFAKNDVGNPTIATGDFNFSNYDETDKTSKSYTDFMRRFNPIDTFRVTHPGLPGFTNDPKVNPYAAKDDKQQRLDYIFAFPEHRGVTTRDVNYKIEVVESKIMFTEPVRGKFLSDHFGITTTFRFYLK